MLLASVAQVRTLDRMAQERLGLSEAELIERAGRDAAELVTARYGPLGKGQAVAVLCGKGHNAADGLVAAGLWAAAGTDTRVVLAFPEAELAGEAAAALDRARRAGSTVHTAADSAGALRGAVVVVDALVGTGARLPLTGALAGLVRAANAQSAPVVALDLPSGLDADSGLASEPCIRARTTLTFLAAKLGLVLEDGPSHCGDLVVSDLDIPVALTAEAVAPPADWFDRAAAVAALPARPLRTHKRQAEVLVVAGSREYLGAALLCARGAYRAGAGLVRLVLPEALAPAAMAALPEAVVAGLSADGHLSDIHLEAVLALAASARAAVVGPGLGRHPGTQALVRELWLRLALPAVFDADALTALELGSAPMGERVLTPHEGELKRLQGAQALDQGRLAAVRALAARSGGVALLKGPATLVAGQDGRLSVNSTGSAVLATAGTGDVLAGVIAALLAQGAGAFAAAGLGAWVHGLAGQQWAACHAGRGLLATDLADALPTALAAASA